MCCSKGRRSAAAAARSFWRGHARLASNRFERARTINLFAADKPLRLAADGSRVDVDAGGLGRRLRLLRLPERNETWHMRFEQPVRLRPGDNPLYVRLTQEGGHQAWSSPIYAISA